MVVNNNKLGGVNDNICDKWLVANVNTGLLRSPTIERGKYGCIDSVDLAVNYAHEVSRFDNKINVVYS